MTTGKIDLPVTVSSKVSSFTPDSGVLQKPISRKQANRKSRKAGFSSGGLRGSRPETPLLWWKVDKREEEEKDVELASEKLPGVDLKSSRKVGKERDVTDASARKLAAALWRLQLPEVRINGGGEPYSVSKDNGFAFQPTIDHSGIHSPAHHTRKSSDDFQTKKAEVPQGPNSVSRSRTKFLHKLEPKFHFSNSAMEGVTKWDPASWKTSEEVKGIYGRSKHVDDRVAVVPMVSLLESALEQAQARIHELETEQWSSKKKLEQFLKKLNEERAIWRRREHEKIRAVIDDVKGELNRERKNRQRMEVVNSKLVTELAEAKLSGKRYMQDYEKEKKARELIGEICDELAKEIGEDKAEVEALKRESMKMREEVDDERKMLQIAEVWREERVQMKLVDAKVTLEDKYSHMNKLVKDLEAFMNSKGASLDAEEMKRAEILRQCAGLVNIQEIQFTYEPPNSDDMFTVFEDFNMGETHVREIEPSAVYSPASHASEVYTLNPEIHRHPGAYFDQNGDTLEEDDESGWETVSHLEDQGSSYSPSGSDPITEISEVCSVPSKQPKKGYSISGAWRSSYAENGEKYKIVSLEGMKGRVSTRGVLSPGHSSPKSVVMSPLECESSNPPMIRGIKGCIQWPRGMVQKNSLKAKLLEARMESQKIQLHQVLKQKI